MPSELPSEQLLDVIAECMKQRHNLRWAQKHLRGDAAANARSWVPLNLQDFQYGFRCKAKDVTEAGLELKDDTDLSKEIPEEDDMRSEKYAQRVMQEKKADAEERQKHRAEQPLTLSKKKRKLSTKTKAPKKRAKKTESSQSTETRADVAFPRSARILPALRMGVGTVTRTTMEAVEPAVKSKSHKAKSKGVARPPSAYAFFVKQNSAALREDFKDKELKQPDIIRILAKRWTTVDKAPYEAMHEEAKAKYLQARGPASSPAKKRKDRTYSARRNRLLFNCPLISRVGRRLGKYHELLQRNGNR